MGLAIVFDGVLRFSRTVWDGLASAFAALVAMLDVPAGLNDWAHYLGELYRSKPDSGVVGLIAASLATTGWIYTARRNAVLSRRQHSFNALLNAESNALLNANIETVAGAMGDLPLPDLTTSENMALRRAFEFLLNHYEFIAAGIRIGDFSETMFRNAERGTVLTLYDATRPYIDKVREKHRRTAFEHLEWLYRRWSRWSLPPQAILEWMRQRPLYRPVWQFAAIPVLLVAVAAPAVTHRYWPFRPIPAVSVPAHKSPAGMPPAKQLVRAGDFLYIPPPSARPPADLPPIRFVRP